MVSTDEWKDVEDSGSGMFKVLAMHLLGGTEKNQSG
jgi:hypothetical protein